DSSTADSTSTTDSSAATNTSTTDSSSTDTSAVAAASSTTDDALISEGKITDEGTAAGLTDSDVTPGMSDANGASITADQTRIPSGYKADPTEGRYTFGILSLGPVTASDLTSYNQEYNTNYYIRVSVDKNGNNGVYNDSIYIQLVDADTDSVLWETTSVPGDSNIRVGYLQNTSANTYYTYSYTTSVTNGVESKGIYFISNLGTWYSVNEYEPANPSKITQATGIGFDYPIASTVETRYIATDAAGNNVVLATYDETGRIGYEYTASGERSFTGLELTSAPSSASGTLARSYKVGDVYITGNKNLSGTADNPVLQIARVEVVTATDGTCRIEMRVAKAGASLSDINNSDIWKTIFSTEELKPGEISVLGNNEVTYNGVTVKGGAYTVNLNRTGYDGNPDGYNELIAAGFTDDQLTGWNNFTTNWLLNNRLTLGQETIDYYYAPQGQVRINYVTSDGTAIQAPVTAYENSNNNTSYDVTGSSYHPDTITVNGKTYRYVKSDKSLGTAGTTTINGFTYNTTPSDVKGTINSNTVNDVYFVYEQVTYHTETESKTVTRTIEYYDSVTGEAIPSTLESSVTQTATLNASAIYDDKGTRIGYGTVSDDGSSYTLAENWTTGEWAQQDSADLSDYGYTAPDRASVDKVTVSGDTTDVTEKVYYGHQTTTVTPDDPVTPGDKINPNDPNSPVYSSETDRSNLVKNASQTIHYVGAGDDTPADNVVTQKDAFTRTVTIDKVTGEVLSYTDWTGTKTFEAVDTPVVDGYHADVKTAGSLTATPDNPDVETTV
ncbi:mucin-binding protein, partial [Lactobacillus nasalidis]